MSKKLSVKSLLYVRSTGFAVLAVLGMIYVNISSRMDVIQQQQIAPVPAPAAVNPSPYLPMPTQTPGTAVQPVVVADPVVSEELAHATAELERMKKENEDLKKRHAMAEEERALLERANDAEEFLAALGMLLDQ